MQLYFWCLLPFMRKQVYILFLFAIMTFKSSGQQYGFRKFSLEEGLPQTEVFSMIQDSKQNIWVGTNGGGLSRFNGKIFETYTTQDGLKSNQIWSLFEDSGGNIWIGGSNVITRYDGITFNNITEAPVPFLRTYQYFHEDPDGNLWVISTDEQFGFRLLRLEEEGLVSETNGPSGFNEGNSVPVNWQSSPDGVLYLSTLNGLYELHQKEIRYSPINELEIFQDHILFTAHIESDGTVWLIVTTPSNQTMVYTYKEGMARHVSLPLTAWWQGLTNIFRDSHGRTWFGNFSQGIAMQDAGKGQITYYNQNNGLPSDFILNYLEDHEGNIWMGSQGNGIIQYSRNNFIAYDFENIIKGNVVRAIYQDSKGNYWFGVAGTGIVKFNGTEFKSYSKDQYPGIGNVREFTEIDNNTILLATLAGLFHFNGKYFYRVDEQYGFSTQLAFSGIIRDENVFWFSTFGNGIFRITGGQVENFTINNTGMQSNQVHSMFKDADGNMLFSTNSGLTKYNGKEFRTYTTDDGLSHNIVLQTTQDQFGRYWAGTFGGGVNILDNDQIHLLTINSGLTSNLIYSMLTDHEGNIWAGSQNGVDKIILDSTGMISDIIHYGVFDGFTGIENNGSVNFVDRENNLWFGTVKGAMRFNPNIIKPNTLHPVTRITKVRVFFREVDWRSKDYDHYRSGVSAWFALPENLVFPHDSNHLSFDFEALSYQVPEKVKYQWKLTGLDKDWSPVSTNTEAVYPNIPPGEYSFVVRAMNNDGHWSLQPAEFSFKINFPWFATWWFISIAVLVFSAVIYIIFRVRINIIKANKRELEIQVEQKTAEVVKKNKQLEQQKEEILTQAESLQKSYNNLENLSEIGKMITSKLSVEKIVETIYESINKLMDATVFGIGIVNRQNHTIEFTGVKEKGETISPIIISLDDELRLSTYCVKSRKEIYINDFEKEYKKYLPAITPPGESGNSSSIIYIPLIHNKNVDGVITVQSFEKNAYSEYQLNILRNLAVYTKIALENAAAYQRIEEQKDSLREANRNISNQKIEIEKVNKELIALNEEKNHLIGIVAHDLRNPLTSSLSIASNLESKGSHLDEDDKDSISFLVNALNRMNTMISNILDIRMIEEQKVNLKCEKTDFSEIIREVYIHFQDIAKNKQININLDNKKLFGIVDKIYLTQVFENLLSNAIKFSPPKKDIWIKVFDENGEIRVSFIDQGPGISEEDMKMLFHKFQRLSASPTAGEKSTGLGLSIVKKYVDTMGGRVWCESTPGKGANFTVAFRKTKE